MNFNSGLWIRLNYAIKQSCAESWVAANAETPW